jgi:hypothetical protein
VGYWILWVEALGIYESSSGWIQCTHQERYDAGATGKGSFRASMREIEKIA